MYVINSSVGYLNKNEFIEINEYVDKKKIDNLFMRKFKKLLRINFISNKIGIEEII